MHAVILKLKFITLIFIITLGEKKAIYLNEREQYKEVRGIILIFLLQKSI